MGETTNVLDQQARTTTHERQPEPFSFLRLKFNDPLIANTAEAKIAEAAIHSLNAIKKWSSEKSRTPLLLDEEGKLESLISDTEKIQSIYDQIKYITKNYELLKNRSNLPAGFIQDFQANMQKLIKDLLPSFEEKSGDQYKDITIGDEQDLEFLVNYYLPSLRHDASSSSIYVISGSAKSCLDPKISASNKQKFINNINESLAKMNKDIDSSVFEETINNISPCDLEDFCRKYIGKYVSDSKGKFQGNIQYKFSLDPSLEPQINKDVPLISWSRTRIEFLFHNIASNIVKSFIGKDIESSTISIEGHSDKKVTIMVQPLDKSNFLQIVIEDNGRGYPQSIIDKGFEEAYKQNLEELGYGDPGIPTEATGMRKHAAILAKYGGEIIVENIVKKTDNKKEIITGARTIIKMPIHY